MSRTVHVNLPNQPYRVHIAAGLLQRAGSLVREVVPHDRAQLVVDSKIGATHGETARASLEAAGYDVTKIEIEASEARKSLETIERILGALAEAKLERTSPVVALGGGIVGDVAGFAASIWLRGVPCVQIPTTLLAMVDASIGGKTGVNFPLPRSAGEPAQLGKNLVGAFWQPRVVLADPLVLATLDQRDVRCGLAECIKHALIVDASLLEWIMERNDSIVAQDVEVLSELVARCAHIKASIVAADERESGRRALLNLGHTFAHAIEPIAELDLRHGEAVAIGLCAAAHAAHTTGRLEERDLARIESAIDRFELPTRMSQPASIDRLMTMMGYDKKVSGGGIRLVLLESIGAADVVSDVALDVIRDAWRHVGAA